MSPNNPGGPRRADLDRCEHDAVLIDGGHVHISAAGPGDEADLRAFYDELSDHSSYLRFFGIRRAIPPLELTHRVADGPPSDLTLLARDDDRTVIGVGEFHRCPNQTDAEVAFAVGDSHHERGVSTLLFEGLACVGLSCGIQRFVAQTLADNAPMQLVFKTAGCPVRMTRELGVVDVTIDLDGDALGRAARARAAVAARHTPVPCARATSSGPWTLERPRAARARRPRDRRRHHGSSGAVSAGGAVPNGSQARRPARLQGGGSCGCRAEVLASVPPWN